MTDESTKDLLPFRLRTLAADYRLDLMPMKFRKTMIDAASEIDRLLSEKVDCPAPDNAVNEDILTDAEREAMLAMACHCDTRCGSEWVKLSATLRGLLERLT